MPATHSAGWPLSTHQRPLGGAKCNIDVNACANISALQKYGVKRKQFYYTVSSFLPHKNLAVLIYALKRLKDANSSGFLPLLVSGVGGGQEKELRALVKQCGLDGMVRLTGFVGNDVRNLFYRECKAFLFPSIFEGFGMPPVEAMAFGTIMAQLSRQKIEVFIMN